MPQTKTLCIIKTTKGLGKLINSINGCCDSTIFLFFDYLVKKEVEKVLKGRGIKKPQLVMAADFKIKGLNKVNDLSYDFFKKMSDFKLKKTLNSHLIFHNMPLWQIQQNELRLVIRKVLVNVAEITSIVDSLNPSKITLHSNNPLFYGEYNRDMLSLAIQSVCKSRKIEFSSQFATKKFLQPLFSGGVDLAIILKRKLRGSNKTQLTKNKKKRIILFHYAANGIKTTKPVFDELTKRNYEVLAISLDGIQSESTSQALSDAGIPFFKFDMFRKKIKYSKKRKYNSLWKNLQKNEKFVKLFNYKNTNFFPCIKYYLDYCFYKKLNNTTKDCCTLELILSQLKPDLAVVVNCVTDFGRSSCIAASAKNIISLTIQHGAIGDLPGFTPVFSDKMTLWSKIDEKKLVSVGQPKHKFHITGNSDYGAILNKFKSMNKKDILKKYNLDSEKKIILYAAKFPITNYINELRQLIALFNKRTSHKLIIKLHPGDASISASGLSQILKAKNAIVMKKENIYDLLVACDVLITAPDSTTGSDAAILNKDTIILNFEESRNQSLCDIEYIKEGVALYAKNIDDLGIVLGKLKNKKIRDDLEKKRKKFAKQNFVFNPIPSQVRIADFIEKLVNNKKCTK